MYKIDDVNETCENTNIKDNYCEGCIDNKCDQESHMECPSGCLHDKELCDNCNNNY
jgi:hypothetical protein